MGKQMKLKRAAAALALCLMLLTASLAFAQETAPASGESAASDSAPGITTLVVLLGVGAIIVVGGAMLARDNFREESDSQEEQ
jgi:hypothetical protein